jgi:hypothetical protein
MLCREYLFIVLQSSYSDRENIESDDDHMITFGSGQCFGLIHMSEKAGGEYISRYKGVSLVHHYLNHLWDIFLCLECSLVCISVKLGGDSSDDSIFITKEKLVAIETSVQRKSAREQIQNAKTAVTLMNVEQMRNQGDGVSAGEAEEITVCPSPCSTPNGKNVAECKTNQISARMVYAMFCDVPMKHFQPFLTCICNQFFWGDGGGGKFQEHYFDTTEEKFG